MRFLVASVLSVLCLSAPVPASGQPSFDCSGRLNPTEALICAFPPLGTLDAEMAAVFRQVAGRLSPEVRTRFVAEQRDWLDRRNACGLDQSCLMNVYRERVAELRGALRRVERPEPTPVPVEPPAAPRAVQVGADGMIERPRADGAVDLFNPITGFHGVRWPDGRITQYQFLEVQPETPPTLPPDYGAWSDSVASSVESLVDNLLRPDEAATLAGGAPADFFQRLDYNLKVLAFITGQ